MASKESPLLHILSGASAGLLADMIVHPVDTIRTRLQMERSKHSQGMLSMMKSLIKYEGFRAFYKGFGIVAFCTVPAHALYFSGYEMAKTTLSFGKPLEERGPILHFVAGFWADVVGAFVWVPQDIIKQRLQVQRTAGKYRGPVHALQTIIKEEGLRGMYKGYMAALATYGPFVGFYFVAYEELKKITSKIFHYKLEDSPFYLNIVNGIVAGAIASGITCPMDVIKTRLQVEDTHQKDRYKNILDAITRIFREEGIRAFGKGMVARILWIAPGTGITIASYESFKRQYNKFI